MLACIVFLAPETFRKNNRYMFPVHGEETHLRTDPVKLREKARAVRKETGDDRWKAAMEKHNKSVAKSLGYSLLRPFQLLAFEPSRQTPTFTLSCRLAPRAAALKNN